MSWLLLGGALAGAAPAQHVRAAAAPPERFVEVDGRREVRVWWDDDGAPKDVEVMRHGDWETVAAGATPGVSVGRLAPGAVVRVSEPDGAPGEAVAVRWTLGPAELARLAAPDALPGSEVADIAATEEGAWVSLQEGGLAFVPKDALRAEPWGVAEGLPSSRVLSVAVDGERLWIGTDAGLALAEGGQVVRTWTTREGLPDDWVQSLAVGLNEDAWVGTYRGLAQVRVSGAVQEHLGPLPVYSITTAEEAGPWVGYAGLAAGASLRSVDTVGAELNVWDAEAAGAALYLATDGEGVLRLERGLLLPYWRPLSGAAYALHRQRGVLYVAADVAGLVAVEEGEGPTRAWGVAEGLPGDAVYEVVGGPPEKLWVGTDSGLALLWPSQDVVVPWPRSPLAAGRAQRAVLAGEGFALVGGEEGLVSLGRLPRAWRHAEALPGPVVHLAHQRGQLWVVGEDDAWALERGRVARFGLPIEAQHAAVAGGALFIGGAEGAMRWDQEQARFVALPLDGAVAAMASGPGGLCWIAAGRAVAVVDAAGQRRRYATPHAPRSLAVGEGAVWVGSAGGLHRLDPASGEVDAPAGALGPIRAVALDSRGHPLVLSEGGDLFDALTGVPLASPAQTALVGEVSQLLVDDAGRVWLSGERGAMLLAR